MPIYRQDRPLTVAGWGADVLDLHGLAAPPEWTVDALCAQTDPEAYFPEKGGSTREAKAICRDCPVTTECLTYALEHNERYGVWGGLSERERRRLRPAAGPGRPRRGAA